MKRMRSIFALLLALVMMLALGTTAFAEGESTAAGSITIDNAVTDKTYSIYKIFDLDSHDANYKAVTYKVDADWAGFFADGAAGLTYVTIDDMGYVTWKDGASAANFAAAAIDYATKNGIAADGSAVASSSTVKFESLALGYYLVQSDLGALCSLDTTMADVIIKEKNAEPTIDKQVEEDSTGAFGKTNDADIGQTVNFKTTVTVIDGNPKGYVVHDTMSAGLTFNGTVTVTVNDTAITEGYTLVTTGLADGDTFEVQFTDGTLKANDVVVITYSATVNANAVIAGNGNTNTTKLSYTDTTGTSHDTENSETRTYTWQFDVFKYTKNGETETALEGAKFVLYKGTGDAKSYAVITDGKVTGWTSTKDDATVLTTPADGKFAVSGLDADTYYLEETEAPAGYNKLKDPVEFKIAASVDETTNVGTATVSYGDNSTGTVKVENKTGAELPSTGGIGTTIFYVLGSILVLGAGVVLVVKKRMGKAEN
jgi:fimbrial isopeptide formation D2 family protein/LPXTG-motif cell wall-anchored protein